MDSTTAQPLHRNLLLQGAAGNLEALFWSTPERPDRSGPPRAAIVCHPHPLFGGTMHNKVVYQAAKTLHRFGLPVLRFNFRGVGLSLGVYDDGQGEYNDVITALDFLAGEFPGTPLLLAGFSFGSWVGLRAGCADERVTDLIGMGLPVADLSKRGFSYLNTCEKPKLLVSGEFDQHGPPHQLQFVVEQFSSRAKAQTSTVIVPGADHFFTGHLAELDRAITDWISGKI